MLSDISYITLILMLSAALFFLMAAIRSLRNGSLEGLMYLACAVFFAAAHTFYLYNIPIDSSIAFALRRLDAWIWLTYLFAPSLILLFISFGIVNFFFDYFQFGLIKIYFGLTLLCYLFMLGTDWAYDIRGIIALLFFYAWFEIELSTEA